MKRILTSSLIVAFCAFSTLSASPVQDIQAINQINKLYSDASKMATPSVVTVHVERIEKLRQRGVDPFEYFFGQPRGNQRQKPEQEHRSRGAGSGVIISKDGYIVTNNHVVGDADKVTVTLSDKREYTAEVIGTDPLTDLALIKIDEDKNLKPVKVGDSKKVIIGEHVLAIGNPLSIGTTVTTGIVSATNRSINIIEDPRAVEKFIQTDAAINPGNSGGALVNLKGELIGINTAIASGTGFYAGYGFAVPTETMSYVISQLKEHRKVRRGYIGVALRDVDYKVAKSRGWEYPKGVYIPQVAPNKPGEKAGIEIDDIVLSVDAVEVNSPNELQAEISCKPYDATVTLKLDRGGKTLIKKVTLQEADDSKAAQFTTNRSMLDKIGFAVQELSDRKKDQHETTYGVEVNDVKRYSEAFNEGLQVGDVILKVGREKVNTVREFNRLAESHQAGDVLRLTVSPANGDYSRIVYIEVPK